MSQPDNARRAPVRSARLRVIGGTVEIRDDVPRTRAECPTATDRTGNRVCGHIHCEWHLWIVDRRDAPGRFRASLRSDLRPVWLDWPLPPSCGLDVLERAKAEEWSVAKLAHAIMLSARGVQWFLLKAKTKLKTMPRSALAEFRAALIEGADAEERVTPPPAPPALGPSLRGSGGGVVIRRASATGPAAGDGTQPCVIRRG